MTIVFDDREVIAAGVGAAVIGEISKMAAAGRDSKIKRRIISAAMMDRRFCVIPNDEIEDEFASLSAFIEQAFNEGFELVSQGNEDIIIRW